MVTALIASTVVSLAPGHTVNLECPTARTGYDFGISQNGHLLKARVERGALNFQDQAIVLTFRKSITVEAFGTQKVRVKWTCQA